MGSSSKALLLAGVLLGLLASLSLFFRGLQGGDISSWSSPSAALSAVARRLQGYDPLDSSLMMRPRDYSPGEHQRFETMLPYTTYKQTIN